MLYYYLDGLEKKGPYNVGELKTRNVTKKTLVFFDGAPDWISIEDLPDLNEQIFGKVSNNAETSVSNASDKQPKITLNSSTIEQRKPIRIPTILFMFLAIFVAFGISYQIALNQRTKDFELINKMIDDIFLGKNEVCDYKKSGVSGQLKKTDWLTPNDNDGKALVEYYECASGGFTILTLTRKPNGFELVESYSKNMGYKIPASRWTPGKDYGYGFSTKGYSTPTYRHTIQTAYNEAMAYLSSDKENACYAAGSFDRIKAFDEVKTSFYYIDNVTPTTYSSASNHIKSWHSVGDAFVYNNQWVVWYEYEGKHFEILSIQGEFRKRLILESIK